MLMSMSVPAALSLSDRPEALVESVWLPLYSHRRPRVSSSLDNQGLCEVTICVPDAAQLNFGCFDDALKFAEACNYEVSMFTLLEHRESFWYEQAYPVSDEYFYWGRHHEEVAL